MTSENEAARTEWVALCPGEALPGMIVRLASGGPRMTLIDTGEKTGLLFCASMREDGSGGLGLYPAEMLVYLEDN